MKKLILLLLLVPAWAQTTTPNIGLAQPAHGDPNWDVDLNANFDILDEKLACFGTVSTAGTIVYFDGSTWLCFPGNTSGTKIFQEDASGVPSWATAAGLGDALVANGLNQFAMTNSAQFFSVISDKTGSGGVVMANNSPTILTPVIASFSNATHSHLNAAGGGTLDAAAISSGLIPVARGGTGTASPGLVAGTSISLSGSWPNQTINSLGGAWGGITGTLSAQTDLNTALGLKAALAGPTFTGVPAAPTAAGGTNTTQIATTAFVTSAISTSGGGSVTDFSAGDLSPLFTTSEATTTSTPALSFSLSTAAAHTAFMNNTASTAAPGFQAIGEADVTSLVSDLASKSPLASPNFTGVPVVPTAAVDTTSTQAASTAFVVGQAAAATPLIDGTAAVGTSKRYARGDHVHPTDTTRAPIASPTLTGVPAAPTASLGTNTTQIATTAFVLANSTSGGGGDASTNTSVSVDSEAALFSGSGGKTFKRSTFTGMLKGTSGVTSVATAGTDYTSPSSTETMTNKTLTNPAIASFVNATHSHLNAAGGGTLDAAAIGSGVFTSARLGATPTDGHYLFQLAGVPTFDAQLSNDTSKLLYTGPNGGDFRSLSLNPSSDVPAAIFHYNTVGQTSNMTEWRAKTTETVLARVDPTGNFFAPSFNGTDTTYAGFSNYGQGPKPLAGTNTITEYAPTSVTSYFLAKPGAAATGLVRWDNVSGTVTQSVAPLSGDATTSGSNVVTVAKINGVAVTGTPTSGQVPTATSGTAATWQTPSGGGGTSVGAVFGSCNGTIGTGNATLYYIIPTQGTGATAVQCNQTGFSARMPMPAACTAQKLYVIAGTAGAVAGSGVVALRDSGGVTALTCTLGTGTTCNDTTHTVAFAAGDGFTVGVTTGQATDTTANIRVSFQCL